MNLWQDWSRKNREGPNKYQELKNHKYRYRMDYKDNRRY